MPVWSDVEKSVRIYRIWRPRVRVTLLSLLAFTAVVLAGVLAASCFAGVATFVVGSIVDHFASAAVADGVRVGVVMVVFLGGLVVTVTRLNRLWHPMRMRHPPGRTERLNAIDQRRDAAVRVPHRLVERALRQADSHRRHLQVALKRIGPGRIILLNPPRESDLRAFRPSAISFEPVALQKDVAGLTDLFRMHAEATQGSEREEPAPASEPPRRRLRQRVREIFQKPIDLAHGWLGYFWLFYWVIRMVRSGGSELPFVMVLVGSLALILAMRALKPDRWFLVPGGLVERVRQWRRGNWSVRSLSRETISVVLDLKEEVQSTDSGAPGSFVHDGERLLALPIRGPAALAVVVALFSAAPRPSVEQLRMLLLSGEEAERGSA